MEDLAVWLLPSCTELPGALRAWLYAPLRRTGLPYVLGYLWRYRRAHDLANFAGELPSLSRQYRCSSPAERCAPAERFDAIMDQLTMVNGVRKTTYSGRLENVLGKILGDERLRIEAEHLSVLDIPASTGLASIGLYQKLSEHYAIGRYTLADRYTKLFHDRARGCVFDEDGELIQKRFKRLYYGLYRPHAGGDAYGLAARVSLGPFHWFSRALRARCSFPGAAQCEEIQLLHPEVEPWVGRGTFEVRRMDVFEEIEGKFDIVLSFNLLQRNYFPPAMIERGLRNLAGALNEGGLLILGNTESFRAYRKWDRELVLIKAEGSL
jgi:hypothetical protein